MRLLHAPQVPTLVALARGARVTPVDHEAFAEAALAHNVAGFAVRALDGDRWRPPDEVGDRVRAAHAERALLSGLLRLELAAGAGAIAEACGGPPVVLKGPAVAARLYGRDPELRPFNDLDVLVPRERLRDAADALAAARGFSLSRDGRFFAADGEPWRGFAEDFGHELVVSREAAGRRLLVELHWRMGDDPAGSALDHATLARHAHPLPGLPDGVLAPDAADELLLLCVHLMHHGTPTLLWCIDVGRAAAALSDDAWALAFARAHDRGLSWALHAGLDRAALVLRDDRERPEARPRRPARVVARTADALPEAVGVHVARLAAMPWRARATYAARAAQASWMRVASRTRRTSASP